MASDALDRLATLYNGGAYDATTNPGGMDDGGHTVNFVPALQDVAAVGVEVAANATNLQAAVAAATASASDANADAVTSMAAAAASTTKAEQAEDAAATASNANLSATARAQECEDTKTIIDGLLASVEQYAGTASNAALTATAKANTCTEISDSLAGLLTSVELYTTTASNAALTATGKADECDSIASSLTTLQTTVEGYASNAALSASAALEAAQNAADVVPASSEETAGKIKLATNLMMTEGTDDTAAVTPAKGAATYALKSHTHIASNVGLGNVTNDAQVRRDEMGVAGGVATLGTDGKVTSAQLPTITSNVAVIRTPTITSPADGAVLTTSMPTITCDAYRNVYGVAQASMVVEIATDANFETITYTATVTGAATTYSVPAGHIEASSEYYIGVTYADSDGESSARGSIHVTTAEQLEHVITPSITSPAAGATVYEQPTLTSSAFAVSSGSDTHAASQWRIKTTAGTWDSPLWDSGETASNLTSITVPAGYITAGGNGYDIEVRHKGTVLGWSAWSSAVSVVSATTFANIIGVACTSTGGGGGTWTWIDSAGEPYTPAAGYFNGHPVWGGIEDVVTDGQAMVKIPKFYIKRGVLPIGPIYAGKECWWISDQPATGFRLHPAFYNAGVVIDQIYIGKYQASDDGTKLKSVAGVLPTVSKTLVQFQNMAAARNVSGVTGFMLWSIYQWATTQWLYLVEKATMDSQTATGAGRTSESSAANVDATDVATATYRGIVGLWGNVYQWLDGLKTDGTQICLWDNSGNKTWVTTGQARTAAAGAIYPLTFMDQSGTNYNFFDIFIGDTGPTSNSGATAPDYQYFNEASASFPLVGGGWGVGADAGLWCVSCSGSASFSSPAVGARLAKV